MTKMKKTLENLEKGQWSYNLQETVQNKSNHGIYTTIIELIFVNQDLDWFKFLRITKGFSHFFL